jgi:hypothetical protein
MHPRNVRNEKGTPPLWILEISVHLRSSAVNRLVPFCGGRNPCPSAFIRGFYHSVYPKRQSPGALHDAARDFTATTLVAGALLLLPFGASTLRLLRKNRAA